MNEKLKTVYAGLIQDAADVAELDELVDGLPPLHAEALADEIEARRAELAPKQAPPVPLEDVTAAELAELLSRREDLKDALSPLFASDESCDCGARKKEDCGPTCDKPSDEAKDGAPQGEAPEDEATLVFEPVSYRIASQGDYTLCYRDGCLFATRTSATGGDEEHEPVEIKLVDQLTELSGTIETLKAEKAELESQNETHLNTLRALASRLGIDAQEMTLDQVVAALGEAELPVSDKKATQAPGRHLGLSPMAFLYGRA